MKFHDFERYAHRAFDGIPEAFVEGIDGLTVSRDAPAHPELPGVYTLGECRTEEHLSDYGSSETTRSVIVLYWGSFRALSREDPDFDWEHEAWETLTHELRHHLESLAGDDALEGVDYAADESFKRFEGQPFDPWYYQYGEAVAEGLYRVEKNWYVEQEWAQADFDAQDVLAMSWRDRDYHVTKPAELADVHFVRVHGLDLVDESVELVLVRKRSWWGDVKRMVGTTRAVVLQSDADAEPVASPG